MSAASCSPSMLTRAIAFAARAHEGQVRKGGSVPYIVHPLEALAIVSTMTTDEEVLCAAVLHDVMEDCSVSKTELSLEFSPRVAELVASQSENKRAGLDPASTWRLRKEETILHLQHASIEEKQLALADKLSNLRSIQRDYALLGDALWERFNEKNPKSHYWYYASVAKALLELQGSMAFREYIHLLEGGSFM